MYIKTFTKNTFKKVPKSCCLPSYVYFRRENLLVLMYGAEF